MFDHLLVDHINLLGGCQAVTKIAVVSSIWKIDRHQAARRVDAAQEASGDIPLQNELYGLFEFGAYPDLLFLGFLNSLLFPLQGMPCFFECFSRFFGVEKMIVSLVVFLAFFRKSKEKQGTVV